MAPPSKADLHLLSLPPEIRNHIWTLLLARKDSQCKTFSLDCRRAPLYCYTLLRAACLNHQLYNEMVPIFFGSNRFSFATFSAFSSPTDSGSYRTTWLAQPNTIQYGHFISPCDKKDAAFGLQLSPFRLRQYFKILHLDLIVPGSHNLRDEARIKGNYQSPDVDWLLPVRELKALGFGRLETFEIEISYTSDLRFSYNRDAPIREFDELEEELKAWVTAKIEGMGVDAAKMKLKFTQLPVFAGG